MYSEKRPAMGVVIDRIKIHDQGTEILVSVRWSDYIAPSWNWPLMRDVFHIGVIPARAFAGISLSDEVAVMKKLARTLYILP